MRADLLELAKRNNIKDAEGIIELISSVASGWPEIALNCGVPNKMVGEIASHFQFMH